MHQCSISPEDCQELIFISIPEWDREPRQYLFIKMFILSANINVPDRRASASRWMSWLCPNGSEPPGGSMGRWSMIDKGSLDRPDDDRLDEIVRKSPEVYAEANWRALFCAWDGGQRRLPVRAVHNQLPVPEGEADCAPGCDDRHLPDQRGTRPSWSGTTSSGKSDTACQGYPPLLRCLGSEERSTATAVIGYLVERYPAGSQRRRILDAWLDSESDTPLNNTTKRRILCLTIQLHECRPGYRPPDDVTGTRPTVLVEYVSNGQVAIITSTGRMPITPSRPSWLHS